MPPLLANVKGDILRGITDLPMPCLEGVCRLRAARIKLASLP